jgi:hypothetical protein
VLLDERAQKAQAQMQMQQMQMQQTQMQQTAQGFAKLKALQECNHARFKCSTRSWPTRKFSRNFNQLSKARA